MESFLTEFLRFSKWAFVDLGKEMWFVSIAIVTNLLLAVLFNRPRGRAMTARHWIWFYISFSFPILILAISTLLWRQLGYDDPQASLLGDISQFALFLAALVVYVWTLRKEKGHRWFVSSIILFHLLLMFLASFIGGMILTPYWL